MNSLKNTFNKDRGIFKKILFSFLFFSILPLIVFALITAFLFTGSNEQILNDTRILIDKNVEKNLMIQAKQVSRKVETFLRNREFELLELSKMNLSESTLTQFSQSKNAQVWIRSNSIDDTVGVWQFLPLYKEIEFVDNDGNLADDVQMDGEAREGRAHRRGLLRPRHRRRPRSRFPSLDRPLGTHHRL